MRRKAVLMLLIASIVGTSVGIPSIPATQVMAQESVALAEDGEIISKSLYCKEDAWSTKNVGLYRGYYHDRQHLGIYLKQGGSLRIRIANASAFQQSLKLDLLCDDSQNESTHVIPGDGSWLNIKGNDTVVDCVPFIQTPESKVEPVIEFEYSEDGMEPLTYYSYGGNMQEFLTTWKSNKQEFVVLDGERVTILVPRCDIEKLPTGTAKDAYEFATLDELLHFYTEMQEQYDRFAGLDDRTETDKNVKAKYFVKADKHGVGAAYYSGSQYMAQTASTISGFLRRNWMVLHELGHGYDSSLASGDLPLVEMMNNIFSHYFERTYLTEGDYGWNNLQELTVCEEKYQNQVKKGTTFSEMSFDARLYWFVNLLNKIGPEESMSDMYRAWRRQSQDSETDFIVEQLSKSSGYNLVPYFEHIGIKTSEIVKARIYESNLPFLTMLQDVTTSSTSAQNAMNQLNQGKTEKEDLIANGTYGLVTNDELTQLNKKGNVQIRISIENLDKIQGKEIALMDGTKVVATQKVEDEQVTFANVPVGTYRVKMPLETETLSYTDYTVVTVKEHTTVTVPVQYVQADQNLLKDDLQVEILGLADQKVATVTWDADTMELSVQNENVQPHYYFNTTYASVTVTSPSGSNLLEQSFTGNKQYEADEVTTKVSVGSVVKIYHMEMQYRLKAVSAMSGLSYSAFQNYNDKSTGWISYVVTEDGLQRQDWSKTKNQEAYEEFYREYAKVLDESLTKEQKEQPDAYTRQKAALASAILSGSSSMQNSMQKEYPYLFTVEEAPEQICQHDYQEVITKATTTKDGKIEKVCKLCQEKSEEVTVIAKASSVKLSTTKYVYDGKSKTPVVTVKDANGKQLKQNVDYTIQYPSKRSSIGTYTVKVTFKGNYSGTKSLTYSILPGVTSSISATQSTTSIKLSWKKVSGATGYRVYKYDVKKKTYVAIKTTSSTSYTVSKLKAGTGYLFAVKAYKKDSKGKVYWSSSYRSLSTATKPSVPTLKATSSKGKVNLSWTNVSGESGYQVYYATKKSGTYKKLTTTKANVYKYSKKLTKGKTYYLKVRAYKKVGSKTIYSDWSKVKSIRVR